MAIHTGVALPPMSIIVSEVLVHAHGVAEVGRVALVIGPPLAENRVFTAAMAGRSRATVVSFKFDKSRMDMSAMAFRSVC